MLVLQGVWDNLASGALHIWAEDSNLAAMVGGAKGRGRQPKVRKALPHPFTLSGGALLETLSQLILAEVGAFKAITLLLPSIPGLPLPSPQLILDEPKAEKATELAPWEIPTLSFEAGQALDLLLALPEQSLPELILGNSLCYWVEVARFTLEVVARQAFVPSVKLAPLTKVNGKAAYQASWEIKLESKDRDRFQTLAKAMPPLCRAFALEVRGEKSNNHPTSKSDLPQPLEILTSFLNQTVDAFVKGSLTETPFLPRRLRKSTQPLPEQWLHALASPDNPTLSGSTQELKNFAQQVRGWLNHLQPIGDRTPFRTCFRLEPPPEPGKEEDSEFFELARLPRSKIQPKNWRLGFFLQANDDPSLLVEASQVWKARSGTLTMLKRQFENPQERLLADLGKASRIFPHWKIVYCSPTL